MVARIRASRRDERVMDSFWEREAEANSTERKPLDDLDYILVPFDRLPFNEESENPEICECQRILHTFEDPAKKAVNLTGYSNTELKLMYGAPNITILTTYDQNYTLLVRTLQKWATLLIADGKEQDAVSIMEYAVSIGTDISTTYKDLATIYLRDGNTASIDALYESASSLNGAMKNSILKFLDEARSGASEL